MANVTKVPNRTQQFFGQWGRPGSSDANPRLAQPAPANATTYLVTSPLLDENGDVVSVDFLMGVRDAVTGYVVNVYVPASGISADGKTLTNCVSGINLTGLDWTTGDPDLAPAIAQDSPVFVVVAGTDRTITQAGLTGEVGVSSKFYEPPTFMDDGIYKDRVFADTTARDLAIPSPQNGMSCYITADGVFNDYEGGAWVQRASGATPNASTSVAGKVQIATQTEFDNGTSTGGTGALLSATPDVIQKGIQKGSQLYAVTSGGTTVYAATLTPTITAYVDGQVFRVKMNATNTGSSTIAFNGLSPLTIVKFNGTNVAAGDLLINSIVEGVVDGSNFKILALTSPYSFLSTKGDLIAATAAGVVTRLGVGSDAQSLVVDSTQSTGMKWDFVGKYSVNADETLNSWFTQEVDMPFIDAGGPALQDNGWTIVISNPSTQDKSAMGYRYANFTSTAGHGSIGLLYNAATFKWDTGKSVRLKFRVTTPGHFGFGLAASTSGIGDETTVNETIKFVWNTVTGTPHIYAVTANGATNTTTNVTSYTINAPHLYEIVWTYGVDVKFYVDGTVIATHTTNIPTAATEVLLAFGAPGSTGSSFAISKPILSIEQ